MNWQSNSGKLQVSEWFWLVVIAAITDNVVVTSMLGLCPLINLSKRLDTALGVGMATTAVLTVASALAWPIDYLLPSSLSRLQPLLLIALIASVVQATNILTRLHAPLVHRKLGIFLPLIATNCAVLGIVLLTLNRTDDISFADTLAKSFGGGIGFLWVLLVLASLKNRIVQKQVPYCLQGAPIIIITLGIITLALSGMSDAFPLL